MTWCPIKSKFTLPSRHGGAIAGFPSALRRLTPTDVIVILAMFTLWWVYVPKYNKAVALIAASAFTVIENVFTRVSNSAGDIPGSTPEQWFANVLFVPLLLPFFWHNVFVHPVELSDVAALLWNGVAFTLFVWVLEVVMNYVLIFLFGYNRAWQYHGRDAFFHGAVKAGYIVHWMPLGAVAGIVGQNVLDGLVPMW
eukprot:PhM_4_TR587/c0_g1_i1/m.86353